jgi:polyhydroxyalkanoate synthesis regulator phasin
MLKELMYLGFGSALLAKEKVEEELKKLEERGKISKEEAQSFIDNAKAKGKEEEERMKSEIKKMLKEALDELGVATKADIEELKQKLS